MTDMEKRIAEAVKKVMSETSEFSNVARPKATKASTATQGAWQIQEEPKASSATQGSWDSTDTPGGVSSRAKDVWTREQLVAEITKVALEKLEFFNRPIEGEVKPSSSKILKDVEIGPKDKEVSASTQPAWIHADPETKKKMSASVCAQILSNVYSLK